MCSVAVVVCAAAAGDDAAADDDDEDDEEEQISPSPPAPHFQPLMRQAWGKKGF